MDETIIEIDSILDSIKQMVTGNVEDTNFDRELIIFINSALSIVNKLGVGPDGYKITSKNNVWSEFLLDRTDLELVKTNVYLRVRLMFDPPTNSFLVTAINDQIKEGNWYIEMYHKTEVPVIPEDPEI